MTSSRLRRGPGRLLASSASFVLLVSLVAAACGPRSGSVDVAPPRSGAIAAVGAENEYANVISQIGGRYVTVTAIMSDPNTDPHTFEASSGVARAVSGAQLVVQNGLGYDGFMNKIESASSRPSRQVIDVQRLLHRPDSTPNPHLWYDPATMPAVARALGVALTRLQPDHAAYFRANVTRFDASLEPWFDALAHFKATYPGVAVATTEPVGDYMLQAAGTVNLTPFSLQADIMNGLDPAPQNVSEQEELFSDHRVRAFVYNQQVTDPLTKTFLADARKAGVPVVGVYETMPVPGYSYQSWMLAEVQALQRAVADKISTEKL
jgi:zinc/manganese transport system substrate-binding protein